MYTGLLHLHSFLRYVLLFLIILAIVRSIKGLLNKTPFETTDNKIGLFLMITAHTQLLIGLFLYFISPFIQVAMVRGMGFAMKDSILRFWAVEHIGGMIAAIALITMGRILTKKAVDDQLKHKRTVLFYTLAFLLIMMLIPWPILLVGEGRGWF
ncbi:MAG: hypothetical protein HUU48_01590 [Flavobacteriales bacterium]|nr:hypothetical protein [Flavobacteriales bacterium]